MKSCTVIYNPHSGKKTNLNLDRFETILTDNGYECKFLTSKYRGHITKIIEELDYCDLVISIGGDGTFNEIMTGNFRREDRLLVSHLPVGTTNDIGAMFGYGRDIYKNLELLLGGEVKSIDICTVNNRPFVYVAGFGKFMNVPYETSRDLKKKLGRMAYIIEGAKELVNKTKLYEMSYTIDGETYHGLYSFMMISNANRIAGINEFYKDVKLDDGKFEILISNFTRKKDLVKSLYYLTFSDITKVPGLYFHKTDHVTIRLNKEKPKWCFDGEKVEDDSFVYDIKMVNDVKIMLPKKNIKNLFIK